MQGGNRLMCGHRVVYSYRMMCCHGVMCGNRVHCMYLVNLMQGLNVHLGRGVLNVVFRECLLIYMTHLSLHRVALFLRDIFALLLFKGRTGLPGRGAAGGPVDWKAHRQWLLHAVGDRHL